ncbi:ATP-binding cassette domain-containing protein, partial [Providencia stuartii]|nr:ATP-binding cassette domain-containing protein [Providencia stuartii]
CNPAYSKSIQTWLRFGEIMRGSLRVMSGLLSPTSGNIYINDINVDTIGLNNYRDRIACVLQDDKLFSGTIAENISSFESVKDDKRIVECAILSNIHEEIMKMPMGYETMLSELGGSLSGGQKQRLMIARALYKQPSILFLDEATSHLDLKNEAYINQSISSLKITRIIIAHRESTIASVDRVLNPWEAIAKLERRSQRDVSKINDWFYPLNGRDNVSKNLITALLVMMIN